MIMPVKLLQASGLHVYVLATFWRVWGAHLPSVPPILLFWITKLCCTFLPQEVSNGVQIARPRRCHGQAGATTSASSKPKPGRGGFLTTIQRNVCWRSRDDIMFVYCILSILLAQYTHEFLFLLINQMFGVKKKKNYAFLPYWEKSLTPKRIE